MLRNMIIALVLIVSSMAMATDGALKVDPKIQPYKKVSGVSGNLSSVGSDTLNNLMALWSEGFRKMYPNVNVQVEGKGSGTAPPALIQGTSQLGPMSRPMKAEERENFEKKKGYAPTLVGVGLDALAVYVHKDNPLESMSLEQVDAIFSKTRKGGHSEDVTTWGQIKKGMKISGHPISIYGRNSASGTYGYFKKHALFKGDYKDSVKEQPGSSSVVMAVTEDEAGIGYSGIGYKTSGVKILKLSKKGGPAVEASAENVFSKKYPLGRMLIIYVDKKPNQKLNKTVEEFMRYILSKEGQEIVVKGGYIPLPSPLLDKQLAALN